MASRRRRVRHRRRVEGTRCDTGADRPEALVRVSTMVGWPTDAEIEEAGYTDAGEFLLNLRQFSNVYDRFMATHATSWDQEPRQPIERCVDHLIAWIIRVVAAAG